jgi:ribosome-associated heat shock protein Hsp15
MAAASPERQRIDKWLFFARLAKSRTLGGKLAAEGHVRVNGDKKDQASHLVRVGDVLTVVLDRRVVVVKILDTGLRRGPASEARLLYEDLSPPVSSEPRAPAVAERERGAGRPTKAERRAIDRLIGADWDPDQG